MGKTESMLQAVLNSLPGIVFWKSRDLAYLGANNEFLKLVGLMDESQLIGKTDAEVAWSKEYQDYFSQYDHKVMTKQEPVLLIEREILTASSNIVTIVTNKFPLYDDQQTLMGMVGLSSTVLIPLVSSQTWLENIIEIIPYFIFWKNIDSIYLGCNRKFAALVGKKSVNDVIGKNDFDLNWGINEAELFRKGDQKTLQGNLTINVEEEIIRADGSTVIMLVNKVPLLDKSGHCIGVLGASADITEFKNTQFRLKEVEERLAAIKALSASIAHELRTPLSAIQFSLSGTQNYLPTLVDAYHLAKQHHLPIKPIQPKHLLIITKIFDSIASEVRYSETIISMILMNVKQLDISTDFKLYSMNACIEEAINRYPFKRGEKKLIQWIHTKDFVFKGDKTLMVHILFNLLKNALYYIQAVNKGRITIQCDSQSASNVLYFKDTAQGISADILPRLFEQFYTTTYHGTGLGLAFCKKVMTSFGGTIRCLSSYGKFTQFELVFPKL